MSTAFDGLPGNAWQLLELAVDGPLHPGGRAATRTLLDRADVGQETTLLDIGCGSGEALDLATDKGASAVGLDQQPRHADAVRGDMSHLPFATDSVDVALGECVLCLAPSFERTLTELERVLVPGGRLAFSDVTVDGATPSLPVFEELLCLDGRRDEAYLRDALADAGFEIRDVRSHREDLLSMRDRIQDAVDTERLLGVLGEDASDLRDAAQALDEAVEAGRIGYVSVVARTATEPS
jgi:arsenite methyltransferase